MIVCMARHFYRLNYPNQARDMDKGLSNAFVAFTRAIGLGRYFSFTPADFSPPGAGNKKDYDTTTNPPISQ